LDKTNLDKTNKGR